MKNTAASLAAIRARLPDLYRAPESDVLAGLVPQAAPAAEERQAVLEKGRELIAHVRAQKHGGMIDSFLHEYRLNTAEGLALLTLAEAYLRVPDVPTADALIRDKLTSADWEAHKGKASSVLVNSATLGLVITKALVKNDETAGVLKKLIARMGEPFIRIGVGAAMRVMGEQFVMGRTIEEALTRAAKPGYKLFRYSFDMLGEAARTAEDAERYFKAYTDAIRAVGADAASEPDFWERNTVSVKLSALHPRYEVAQADRCVPELVDKMVRLCIEAREAGIGLTVDAEEADRLEMSLDIMEAIARAPELKGWDGLGMAVQAYQKRALAVIDWADALAEDTQRKLTVRLVKGAYWDAEIKRAQEQGLSGYPVYTRKVATDVSYLACAKAMLQKKHLYPAFASHNAHTVATILTWAGARRDFELQRLHGMGNGMHDLLVERQGYHCRVYAPVGGHSDLLAYLVRRLLENGANSSFVHQLADPMVAADDLLRDPASTVEGLNRTPHPAIALPLNIYGDERRNSEGIDMSDEAINAALLEEMQKVWAKTHTAAPVIGGQVVAGAAKPVIDPADRTRTVGSVVEATPQDVARAIGIAQAAAKSWSQSDVALRAQCLERLGDLLERDRAVLMALAVREAGKSIPDALAEVREAVDFCRYYAVQARKLFQDMPLPGPTGESNVLRLTGRGVFACIAPWNFPLAIFLGQITAALVAGNAVVAKPAPQTPLIAAHATRLILEAGVPAEVFHLLPGGPDVGSAMTGDPRVMGVAFTGSTGTAKRIARTLLEDDTRPIVPFIAETGGLNAMIVDSTALPEQVVRDVIISAFQSAGQRCSAARLLCVQEDVAPRILDMLRGAMCELRLGDPGELSTDIGPVIDEAARAKIEDHLARNADRILFRLDVPAELNGHFVGPAIVRLDQPEDLKQEIFGPVLHVATWKAGELAQLVERINASGYGLTMGLHSRMGEAAKTVAATAHVGNLYVNRSMIGAVVGVQPFGGEGLSGTGPKAGGPHYLLRFAAERAVSIDTTSAGGNTSLLALADDLAV
ncbi:bifunctional proline dehydrogenase/L-glutamate gamma-semialdehyde dehydrogenase PutA [Pedomonas mirosovicensis]|uniref:bifunctional proline dehydrogenase/L-glutamate gamma-semialdehyde dehydrogenase PutA n=1 Tax=Pedomonas mirosovicensis TaxID=2908641 RepID=UPI00216727A8|nr:bifunctional proline dehydrogenase/L-glutamate gamma-semialdehyde dehydrogenase PutA [Pedomonas mirosovicensis]MCH8684239.1 bifunctional proline dehydrogenase/L-glutamate gamma-semialdehyde dehydrogenase PutA [Pedomonas mirosovicensis]